MAHFEPKIKKNLGGTQHSAQTPPWVGGDTVPHIKSHGASGASNLAPSGLGPSPSQNPIHATE